jgi:GMP synthase (glutamine-hydrolysing)
MKNIQHDKILILDFGSQYTKLIAKNIRKIGVYCEIFPYFIDEATIRNFKPQGVILSGGPETVVAKQSPRMPNVIFDLNIPILGICYGMQTLAVQLGGKVASAKHKEFGQTKLTIDLSTPLFASINKKTIDVWMSHGDSVKQLPNGFKKIATSNNAIAAMANEKKQIYAVQFHPEVTHTVAGKNILKQFVINICRCKPLWASKNIVSYLIEQIKKQVGKEQVILGLSGGVDSSVAAALIHAAIGNQLTCVFVDHGLLRLDERKEIENIFKKQFHYRLLVVDAKKQFFSALKNITNPEKKRQVIGKNFIKVFAEAAKSLHGIKWLAQGTIYPDVIESANSANKLSHKIKSHHNVGGLPKKLPFKLLEPLRELFKDEVREIGLELGLPKFFIERHPFPGPGLGVRILGEIKEKYVTILQQADAIYLEELRKNGWYNKISQAFAVFLPVKSVGVVGDQRQYEPVIALRAVNTDDFMTAHTTPLPNDLLTHIANRIVNEVRGVSRVVYDITSKPPATIEWE